MGKLISCCGLNCATCDAYIATITNNEELRVKTAEKWRIEFQSPQISSEMINCVGCRGVGAHFSYCESMCEIRKCVKAKGFDTCGDCAEIKGCQTVAFIHQNVPDALANLQSL